MTKFAEINRPRVSKILKMLETIETSARSNKAEDEAQRLLAPVRERLGFSVGVDLSTTRDQAVVQDMEATSPDPFSRERRDFSIACHKADRAWRSMEAMHEELKKLAAAIPGERTCSE